MKQLIFKYFIFIFTLGVISSCNVDEFLDEKNPNLISTDNFWKNLSETQAGLATVYQTLHKPGVLNKFGEMLRSDMGYPGYGRPNPNNTEDFYLHLYNGSTQEILSKWQDTYLGIFRANQVIEALNKDEFNTRDVLQLIDRQEDLKNINFYLQEAWSQNQKNKTDLKFK